MLISEFVAQTITEICQGIKTAQKDNPDLILAPPLYSDGTIANCKGNESPHVIDFNLSVVVEQTNEEGKSGASINLKVFQVALSGSSGKSSAAGSHERTEQHISFSIPVLWPTNYVQKEKRKFMNPD